MHENGKNSGLRGARAPAALGNILIIVKKAVHVESKTWAKPAIHIEKDRMGDIWENVDMMRRRMTI